MPFNADTARQIIAIFLDLYPEPIFKQFFEEELQLTLTSLDFEVLTDFKVIISDPEWNKIENPMRQEVELEPHEDTLELYYLNERVVDDLETFQSEAGLEPAARSHLLYGQVLITDITSELAVGPLKEAIKNIQTKYLHGLFIRMLKNICAELLTPKVKAEKFNTIEDLEAYLDKEIKLIFGLITQNLQYSFITRYFKIVKASMIRQYRPLVLIKELK